MTVLQPVRSPTFASDGAATRAWRRPKAEVTMASVLQEQARVCLDVLLEHDPAIRLGDPDPEHVHRSRVATRRLRSVLRAFKPLACRDAAGSDERVPASDGVDAAEAAEAADAAEAARTWFSGLREQLSWLGQALGRTRDADVRLQSLEQACAKLGDADAAGAAAILQAAREEKQSAHQDLLEAMRTDQYMLTLRGLEALGHPGKATAEAPGTGRAASLNGATPPAARGPLEPGRPASKRPGC